MQQPTTGMSYMPNDNAIKILMNGPEWVKKRKLTRKTFSIDYLFYDNAITTTELWWLDTGHMSNYRT